MAQLIYPYTAEISVKPSVVNMSFTVTKRDKDISKAINSHKDLVNQLKDYCLNKRSYRKDSYKQSNLSFRKNTKRETYYIKRDNPDVVISLEKYEKLSQDKRLDYIPQNRELLVDYSVTSYIDISLNNDDTVIEDFTSIMNLCTHYEIICRYEHNILPEERKEYMKQLYIQCVNQGVKEITEIIDGIDVFNSKNLKIEEIADNIPNSRDGMMYKSMACMDDLEARSEQYFMPELVKELFNNNILLTKKLDLRITV